MGVSTLLTPYGVLPSWWVLGYPFVYPEPDFIYSLLWAVLGYPFVYPEPDFIYSLLWALGPRAGSWGLHNFVVSNPTLLWATFPLGICNIIFALKVVRYYQDRTSKDGVLRWAIAAFVVPIFALFLQGIIWIVIGFLFDPAMAVGTGPLPYFGPIPIQIAVGLFIVYRIPR
jgi:hypothetical protein